MDSERSEEAPKRVALIQKILGGHIPDDGFSEKILNWFRPELDDWDETI